MSSQPNPDSIDGSSGLAGGAAERDAVKARVAEGDESGLVAWDDLAAERPSGPRGQPLRR